MMMMTKLFDPSKFGYQGEPVPFGYRGIPIDPIMKRVLDRIPAAEREIIINEGAAVRSQDLKLLMDFAVWNSLTKIQQSMLSARDRQYALSFVIPKFASDKIRKAVAANPNSYPMPKAGSYKYNMRGIFIGGIGGTPTQPVIDVAQRVMDNLVLKKTQEATPYLPASGGYDPTKFGYQGPTEGPIQDDINTQVMIKELANKGAKIAEQAAVQNTGGFDIKKMLMPAVALFMLLK